MRGAGKRERTFRAALLLSITDISCCRWHLYTLFSLRTAGNSAISLSAYWRETFLTPLPKDGTRREQVDDGEGDI